MINLESPFRLVFLVLIIWPGIFVSSVIIRLRISYTDNLASEKTGLDDMNIGVGDIWDVYGCGSMRISMELF
jgi:hypothetical protein